MIKKSIIKTGALVVALVVACSTFAFRADAQPMENDTIMIPEDAVEVPARLTAAATADAIQFTCGVMQSGTFGAMPETHTYSVYLRAGKRVAFASTGFAVTSFSIYNPSGEFMRSVSTVGGGSGSRFAVWSLSNLTGYYTIVLTGACGSYTMNCLTGEDYTGNKNESYNREEAVQYANDHWDNPNSNYPLYGADCTNFVSQCVHEGGVPMKTGGTTDAYWHYTSASNRSPSWTGADYFMRHWTKVRLSSYYGQARAVRLYTRDYILNNWHNFYIHVNPGDIIQYAYGDNSHVYHSAIITEKNESNEEFSFCSHSAGQNNGSLKTYISSRSQYEWIIVIRISAN